jgi:hypothetical protein
MDIDEAAARFDVLPEAAWRARDELVENGYLVEPVDGAPREVTAVGMETAARLIAERRATYARLVEGWSPEQHGELAGFLTRLARETAAHPSREMAATG